MDSNSIAPCPQHDLESSDAGRYVPGQERRARPARRRNSNAPPPSPSSRSDNAPGSRPPRPNPLLRAKHFPARFGGGVATALLAALMFLLPSAPSHAQTVAWNATLTSADNWALGNTYTYDGYGSSASAFLTTTHGSLSPGSFTVSETTHTVEVLGVREGTDNRLYLITDTRVSKSALAEYSLEITVDGSTTTLQVSDATDESNLGFYWAENLHPYGPDDWQTNTITVRLLAPGTTVTISADNPTADHNRKTGRTAFFADFTVTASSAPDKTLTVWLGWEEAERDLVDVPSNWSSIDRYVRTQIRAGETSASVAHMLLEGYVDGKPLQTLTFFIAEDRDASDPHNNARADPEYAVGTPSKACVTVNVDTPDSSKPDCAAMLGARGSRQPRAETLGAPEKVSATASGSSRIDLSWTAPSGGPPGYQVEWSPVAEGDWQPVDPAHSGKATEYSHTGLTAETAYYYRVRAFNGDGPGEWSAVEGATTESGPQKPEPPGAPQDLTVSASGESRIDLSWTASSGEVTGYEVQWSADGKGGWTAVAPTHSGKATEYSDTGLATGTSRHYRVRAVNGAGSGEWSGPASATTQRPELTVGFEQAPAEHEGPDSTFTLRLVFSEPVAASYRTQRDQAIEATNGTVRESKRVGGSSAEWEVTVAPSSREAVTVSISGGSAACGQGDAVCTEDGRRLSNSPSVTVEGPPAVPLTAELDGVPEAHDGQSTFTFGLTFSQEPRVGYRTLRDSAFDVGGGAVRKARRRQSGSDLSWEITVEPSSHRDVSIRLPETGSCSASGAICTGDGRPLSHALSASVRGPAAMSVSDARVEEAAGAAVAFAVTLSRAASDRVTVDYRTRDGSAQAGEDYRAASGTLTFSAGEASKTIEVGVLDDAHDEGEETFTLALSNASGAWLEDAEATGTIENADLMPAALLARFGRATAEQVVEYVEQRMAAPRERGFRARFAGRELRPGMERDFALGFLSQFGQPTGMGPGGAVPMGAASMGATSRGANPMAANLFGRGTGTTGMTGRQPPMGVGAAMPDGPSGGAHGGGFGSFLPGGDLFSNSEFELNREQHGGVVSVWSRSSRSYFGGMEGALSLNGDVRTTMLGADYRRGPLTVGLSVGRTLGLGGYGGPSAGQVTTSMTGFYPWLGYQVNDRVSVWGVTGYGTGALSLTPDGATALKTGMSMAMTAAGTRGELIGSRATGGFALAFKADALWVGAATELVDGAAGRLNASEAGVTRVRTALEGSRGFSVGGRVSLTPSVEVGLRQDGGDAETGTGMDVGGGLVFTDSVTGLSLDVRMRTLVVHQADGFTERRMSLSFGWDPTPSSPLGLTARVAPSWGGSAMGGADALWRSQMAYGMGSHQMAGSGGQLNAEVGYGLPVGRFVGTPSVGVGTSQYGRDYRLGYRLGLLERGGLDFGLDVSGTRRESIMTPVPDHQVVTSATVTW